MVQTRMSLWVHSLFCHFVSQTRRHSDGFPHHSSDLYIRVSFVDVVESGAKAVPPGL